MKGDSKCFVSSSRAVRRSGFCGELMHKLHRRPGARSRLTPFSILLYESTVNCVMGPLLLIDKSFLQCLNVAEVRALCRHYSPVICPILLIEIRANLAKLADTPDEAKTKASYLAQKANSWGNFTIGWHQNLIIASLMGTNIPLGPQVPRMGGREVIAPDGSKGIIFEETEEEKILGRWSDGNFTEEESGLAQEHYKEIDEYNLPGSREFYAKKYPENTTFKSLHEISDWQKLTDQGTVLDPWDSIESLLNCYPEFKKFEERIRMRWLELGRPRLPTFAPYAHYIQRLNTIFWLGVTAGLIPTSKKSKTLVDHQYLFYLPFSHAFCSSDNFHRDFSKHFLRKDQVFLPGNALKEDLAQLASFYEALDPLERKFFDRQFGSYPPPMKESLTHQLWKRCMRSWSLDSGNRAVRLTEDEYKNSIDFANSLVQRLNEPV